MGKVFGRLTVVEPAENSPAGAARWRCVCVCGGETTTTAQKLTSGHTTSCGCYAREVNRSHGLYRSPEYNIYQTMIQRCTNEKDDAYSRYGGRGIKVCDRWLESFENFYADMGPRPSPKHTIDRKDNEGDYEPGNCKWETWDVQYRNRRQTVWYEFNGERLCQKDLCSKYNLDEATFAARLRRGWSLEKAVTTPTLTANRNGRAKRT